MTKKYLLRWGRVVIHFAAWCMAAYVLEQAFRTQLYTRHIRDGVEVDKFEMHSYGAAIALGVLLKAAVFYVNALPPMCKLIRGRSWLKFGMLMLLVTILAFGLERLVVYVFYVDVPRINSYVWANGFLYALAAGLSVTYFLLLESREADERAQSAARERVNTELVFLKAQISPHFFLNTLNTFYSMAQARGAVELENGLLELSGMMQYMLYDCAADTVLLSSEITCIQNYIGLNLMRYGEATPVRVALEADEREYIGVRIAPVLLMPFVENAFKHGVSTENPSPIDIGVTIKNNVLFFTVKNIDHSGTRPAFERAGIGISNVRRRLEVLYQDRHELQTLADNGRYTASLKIVL